MANTPTSAPRPYFPNPICGDDLICGEEAIIGPAAPEPDQEADQDAQEGAGEE